MPKTRDMFENAAEPPARGSAVWNALSKALFDPYRPERHYMRGPGPKWHLKHDHAAPLSAELLGSEPLGSESLGAEHLSAEGPGAAHDYRAAH